MRELMNINDRRATQSKEICARGFSYALAHSFSPSKNRPQFRQRVLAKGLTSFRNDPKCRAAVERKFEIMGEACTRIRDRDPDAFEKLPYGHQVIGLRNRVIHGYDSVDETIIWDVISIHLDAFITQVETLASE